MALCIMPLLLAALLLAHPSLAAMHDRKQGLKVAGLSDDEVNDFAAHHNPEHHIQRHLKADEINEHPEVKDFLRWKKESKEQQGEATAWSGKVPHDYIHHILNHEFAPEDSRTVEIVNSEL